MGLEGNTGYSRQKYEDTEKSIGDVARSVDEKTPLNEMREKFAAQDALRSEKESLHNEARDQAIVENVARDEAKVSQEHGAQKVVEQNEATELLKKMHEAAGIKPDGVENFQAERMPEINTKEIEQKRQESSGQFEVRAIEKNKNRSFLKKIFGLGKTSGIDAAHEEANRINAMVDKTAERLHISKDSTADKIIGGSFEFANKTPEVMHNEELVKKLLPEAVRALEGGYFGVAREYLKEVLSKVKDEDERARLRNGMEHLITGKLDSAVAIGGLKAFQKIADENGIHNIGLEQFSRMLNHLPEKSRKGMVESPKIQQEVMSDIAETFSGNREYGVRKANEYVHMGLMTNEAAAAFFHSPETQETLIGDVKKVFSGNREYGVQKANEYIKMGLMTNDTVAAFFQSPDTQFILSRDIESVFSGNRESGVGKANEYVNMGLITNETAQKVLRELEQKYKR